MNIALENLLHNGRQINHMDAVLQDYKDGYKDPSVIYSEMSASLGAMLDISAVWQQSMQRLIYKVDGIYESTWSSQEERYLSLDTEDIAALDECVEAMGSLVAEFKQQQLNIGRDEYFDEEIELYKRLYPSSNANNVD